MSEERARSGSAREAEIAALREAGQELLARCAGLVLLEDDAVPAAARELRWDDWEYVLKEIRWIAEAEGGAAIGYWDRPGEGPLLVQLVSFEEFTLTGRTALDHLAWAAPAERGALSAFAREHGLPAPLGDEERAAALHGRRPPVEQRMSLTSRHLGFQGHDVAGFLIAGIGLGGLDFPRRLVVHNRCRRLSDQHGVELRCVPATDMEHLQGSEPVRCLLGHVLAEAYGDDGVPVPLPDEALREAAARALRLPPAVWDALSALRPEGAGLRLAVHLGATGPLAGATVAYGVLLEPNREELWRASGEDPEDWDEGRPPSWWDWDAFRPDGAEEVIAAALEIEGPPHQAVAGVHVMHTRRWETQSVDLGEAAHEERRRATAALAGPRSYFLMAHFN